eukprot:2412829-Rhodomonas_salina.1
MQQAGTGTQSPILAPPQVDGPPPVKKDALQWKLRSTTPLRANYAMSGTYIAYAALVLCDARD